MEQQPLDLTSLGRSDLLILLEKVVSENERANTLASEAQVAIQAAYVERNACVIAMAKMALTLGWGAGVKRDREAEEGFQFIVYIDFPTGQGSWHITDADFPATRGLPVYEKPWDGHTTHSKYERLKALEAPKNLQAQHPRSNE